MPKTLNLQNERFRTLWTLLRWEGAFRNNQIQKVFGFSAGQASRLIAEFRAAYKGKIEVDTRRKQWYVGPDEPTLADLHGGEVDEYLLIQRRLTKEGPGWFTDGRCDFLGPTPSKFRIMRLACEQGTGVSIFYASLNRPASTRLIFPHAIVQLPQRWHVRAWCADRLEFRDFNFGRMSKLEAVDDARPETPEDQKWNQFVSLRVRPHRDLNPLQFEVVRQEFCDGASARRISLRGALVPYILTQARIATDPVDERPPYYLLELINSKEAKPFLFRQGETT